MKKAVKIVIIYRQYNQGTILPIAEICPLILSRHLKYGSIPAFPKFISEKIFSLWVADFARKRHCAVARWLTEKYLRAESDEAIKPITAPLSSKKHCTSVALSKTIYSKGFEKMQIRAVIFDLDGTLANTIADLASACDYAIGTLGLPPHTLEEYKYFVGNGIKKLIMRASGITDENDETLKNLYSVFMKRYGGHYCDKTVVYDGDTELIEELIKRNIKSAVVTNKENTMANAVIEKLYGRDKFAAVLGQSDKYPTKPDPTAVKIVLERLGVTPEECLFVGDSDVDIITGHNAGMKSVGVLWGFRTEQELRAAGADYIVRKPADILKLL